MTRLCLATLTGCLSLGLLVIPGACQAASIIVDFTATATSGPLAGHSFSGFFSYNNSGLSGVGSESTNPTSYSFNFFTNYSLADTFSGPVTFSNGTVHSFAFLVAQGNDVASGRPDSYISLDQGIPGFLYGFSIPGESFFDSNGNCPDLMNTCFNWEGSGTITLAKGAPAPEPAGPLPVLGYFSAGACLLWLRRRLARHT